jgi:DNA-binding response OmpR family regulator
MKILVAEDDNVSALALRALLEKHGHTVTMTADGNAAWSKLQAEHFPLAILDWMMPGMDGLAVCRRIRSRPTPPYTCVIMLTAKQQREDRLFALQAGADVFLSKPLDAEDLLARLQVAERILALEQA